MRQKDDGCPARGVHVVQEIGRPGVHDVVRHHHRPRLDEPVRIFDALLVELKDLDRKRGRVEEVHVRHRHRRCGNCGREGRVRMSRIEFLEAWERPQGEGERGEGVGVGRAPDDSPFVAVMQGFPEDWPQRSGSHAAARAAREPSASI